MRTTAAMLLMAGVLLGQDGPPNPGTKSVEIGGWKAMPPAGWMEEPAEKSEAVARFRLEPVQNDKEPARVLVLKLPDGEASSLAAVEKYWRGMMLPPLVPDKKPMAKMEPRTIGGRKGQHIDLRGDYRGVPPTPEGVRSDWRLIGYYLEAPNGRYVVRLLGPAATVGAYAERFDEWVMGLK